MPQPPLARKSGIRAKTALHPEATCTSLTITLNFKELAQQRPGHLELRVASFADWGLCPWSSRQTDLSRVD